MENVTTIGIDIAKDTFQVCGLNGQGKEMFNKKITRTKLPEFIAQLPPALIGMEACGSAHYWARSFQAMGHTVKLMSAQYVKPFVMTHKNDRNDARACAIAVTQPSMRFVSIKTVAQHELQSLHRVRSFYIKQRTALMNQIRGLLAEDGIVTREGKAALKQLLVQVIDPASERLLPALKALFTELYTAFNELDSKVKRYTQQLETYAKTDERCQRLLTIPGFGPINSTALLARLNDGSEFQNGRQVSSWLGLVPRQYTTGKTKRLLGISKHGDRYVRTLLIHGARSNIKAVMKKNNATDRYSAWILTLVQRCGINKTAVALANKNARMAWALLNKETTFKPELACKGMNGHLPTIA